MSTTENGTKPRWETILNSIRKEASKIRDANDKLQSFIPHMDGHPASSTALLESIATIRVALEHMHQVFREF